MLKQQNQKLLARLNDKVNKEEERINMDKFIKDAYSKIKKEVDQVNNENDRLHSENKYLGEQVKKLKSLNN